MKTACIVFVIAGLLVLLVTGVRASGAEPATGDKVAADERGIAVVGVRPGSQPAARNWALVIGVNGYAHAPLKYCVKDAALLAGTLRAKCGYAADRVYLMTDGQEEFKDTPTRRNILRTAELVADLPAEADTLLLYFSGHGVSLGEKGYLVPIDADIRDGQPRAEELVSIAELRSTLRKSKASRRVMVLDACHSGGEKAGEPAAMTRAFEDALKADSEGIVTLASCRANETSLEADWHGQGLFTYWLVQGMTGAADREETGNRDNRIEFDELYKFVYERVRAEAVQKRRHMQNPIMLAAISGRIELARVSAVPPTPASRPTAADGSARPPASPAEMPPTDEGGVRREGEYVIVTVIASGDSMLELLQDARTQAREAYVHYAIDKLGARKTEEALIEHARDKEIPVVVPSRPGSAVRLVFKYPIP